VEVANTSATAASAASAATEADTAAADRAALQQKSKVATGERRTSARALISLPGEGSLMEQMFCRTQDPVVLNYL
jgi:hypothetical protein